MKRLPDELAAKLLEASDAMPEGTGFDVSMDEVAKLSGVPRATLYYYFSGRDDLVQFYLNDLLERTAKAVQGAAGGEGSVVQRLEATMRAILSTFAAYPRMCVELPSAVKDVVQFESVAANVQRSVVGPLRDLLIEGRASGELAVGEVDLAAVSVLGSLHMVAMMQLVTTGKLDAEATAQALVPQLMRGLLPR